MHVACELKYYELKSPLLLHVSDGFLKPKPNIVPGNAGGSKKKFAVQYCRTAKVEMTGFIR